METKRRKHWSPYMTKTIKSTKVKGVRVYLKSYQTKGRNRAGFPQEERCSIISSQQRTAQAAK